MHLRGASAALAVGVAYFAMVFSAGFALAPVRELLLAPRIGPVWAELLEMPVMAVVIWFSAGWVARRTRRHGGRSAALLAGGAALAIMISAEVGVVWLVRQQSLGEYVAERDPVAGSLYLMMLLLFGLLPWLRARAVRAEPPG